MLYTAVLEPLLQLPLNPYTLRLHVLHACRHACRQLPVMYPYISELFICCPSFLPSHQGFLPEA